MRLGGGGAILPIMSVTRGRIEKNLQRIREEIDAACARSGRRVEEVSLVAVTKTVGLDEVKHLVDLGVTELGESRAQQLAPRAEEVAAWLGRRRKPQPAPVHWHMIGHLQRNKVKAVLGCSPVIHSVDSLRLAEEVDSRAERAGQTVDVMLQVNCSQEQQKYGVAVGAAMHLGEMITTLKHVRLIGLMTMAPLSDDPEAARPSFVRLRELFEEMRSEKTGGDGFRHLSMGMSQDYPVAVEEGATLLRIGSAVFE